MEEHIGVSFAREIERYCYDNEELGELYFCEQLKESEVYLFKIEPSGSNTMEIL